MRHLFRHVLPVLALLATSSAAAQPSPPRGGTLVIAASSDLQGMNSLVASEAYTGEVLKHVLFLPLVRYDEQLRLQPALARSWKIIGDTLVQFRLRDDVRWHDGRRTTAHDVVFTFERARDPRTGFPAAADLEHWVSVQLVDSLTVRFRIVPHADPLAVWSTLAIMPAHLLAQIAPEQLRNAEFNHAPIGNGPFRFVSRRANDRWIFEPNPLFPVELGGPPSIGRLVWRVVPDNASQVAELLTGQADIMLAPRAEQVQELGTRPGLRGMTKPSRRYYFIDWNGRRPHLSDPRVRRALMMALDRRTMIDVLRKGYAQIATGPIAPYHWAFDRNLEPLPYDRDAAVRLLADAGFRDRNGDGVLESAAGEKLEIELKVAANSAFNRDLGEMIRADLAAIGVTVRPRPVDFATLVDDISSPERNFDAALLAFETEFRLNLSDSFHSEALGGPFQSASYSNPRVDRLLDQVRVTTDRAAALRLYSELQRILLHEQPWGVLWYPPELLLARDRVRGFAPDIRGLFAAVTTWSVAPH
jgi:peptide/nickel transport system substrate-binding protein